MVVIFSLVLKIMGPNVLYIFELSFLAVCSRLFNRQFTQDFEFIFAFLLLMFRIARASIKRALTLNH